VDDRLDQQIQFVVEMDRLKGILRRTLTLGGQRAENSAEHSWHLALMAVLLAEHADEPVDLARVVKMALVHDLVEIDAGDTFVYDEQACLDKDVREQQAADRIFNLLPPDQAAEIRALWDEFEAATTPESRFANAMDRLQPLLLNYHSQGHAWREHGVTSDRVTDRCQVIGDGSQRLWDYGRRLIQQAVEKGYVSR
jgi:putative hydrolases of HD superfamily